MVESIKVLLVDDDPSTRHAVRQMLQQLFDTGSVIEASSGEEALAVMRTTRFDAVLADYRMGALDGIALLEQARALHPTSCRILFTGLADFDLARDAINRAGVHGFLQKPLEAKMLEQALRSGIERARHDVGWLG